jgi:hypothetical protein
MVDEGEYEEEGTMEDEVQGMEEGRERVVDVVDPTSGEDAMMVDEGFEDAGEGPGATVEVNKPCASGIKTRVLAAIGIAQVSENIS